MRGQRGSYEDVEQALVLHVEPQPSLVLHMNTSSGVVASTTRMSSSKSSSVTASASGAVGASRTAVGGAIDIISLRGAEGLLATWPVRASRALLTHGAGQEIVTTPCVLSMTAASAGIRVTSVPAGQ